MPKVMVLFFGGEGGESTLDSVVAGAKSVRFTEVEIRAAGRDGGLASKHKRIDPAHPTGGADGMVIIADDTASQSPDIAAVVDQLAAASGVRDLVFGVAASSAMLDRVARLGGIVIAIEDPNALGARVAKVAGWVRHGLGHEAEHQHGHQHSHDHGHHEHHDHQH